MERSNRSLRFRIPEDWEANGNNHYIGLNFLGFTLHNLLQGVEKPKMLEIGTYKGEAAHIFASLGVFSEIHTIDPWEGEERALIDFNETWSDVKKEYWTNTRQFRDIIHHHKEYSYNMVDKFADGYFDFIYIDANHTYKEVNRDIVDWLPKTNYLIGGHDYQNEWPDVIQAVNDNFGEPDQQFQDTSWLSRIKN